MEFEEAGILIAVGALAGILIAKINSKNREFLLGFSKWGLLFGGASGLFFVAVTLFQLQIVPAKADLSMAFIGLPLLGASIVVKAFQLIIPTENNGDNHRA